MGKIVIIGGGLVGALLSVLLARKGFSVSVFEKRPDIREVTVQAGRSINLVVADRGWKALRLAGIENLIREISLPVYGRMTHDLNGEQTFHQYSITRKAIYSVSRAELNKRLIELADDFDNIDFHFNHKCTGFDRDGKQVRFIEGNGTETVVASDVVIGADGANSEIRKCLFNHLSHSNPAGDHSCSAQLIDHGYKELRIPPLKDGSWALDRHALHIWARKFYMLMALANSDGGFTCTLFLPFKGTHSFEALQTKEHLLGFFNKVFADVIPMMPSLVDDFFANPTSSLSIIKCDPWIYRYRVALIGDAAHAIVPFYGEGMNCGFEDCEQLSALIGEGVTDWESILEEYNRIRKPNADAIADLSMRNFTEMRDLVADSEFLFRKKIEERLQMAFPDKWLPLYSQVKFTDIPYSKAWSEGLRQDVIMQKILAIPGIERMSDEESFRVSVEHLL